LPRPNSAARSGFSGLAPGPFAFDLPGMETFEWRERTDEGLRFWRATRHAGKWTFQTTLKTEPDWHPIDPVPRELWQELRDLLWRKYQRKRVPWEWIEKIDKLLEAGDDEEGSTGP